VTLYAVGQFVHVIRKRIKLSSEKVLPIILYQPQRLSLMFRQYSCLSTTYYRPQAGAIVLSSCSPSRSCSRTYHPNLCGAR
jgi:hypothetical protein